LSAGHAHCMYSGAPQTTADTVVGKHQVLAPDRKIRMCDGVCWMASMS
jgi:hypothetical protein